MDNLVKVEDDPKDHWEYECQFTGPEDRALAMHRRPRAMHPYTAHDFPWVATLLFLAWLLGGAQLREADAPSERATWERPDDDRPPVLPLDNLIQAAPNAPAIWA